MIEKISEPGIYEMPEDIYHGDCCVGPSLGSSGAHTLSEKCPAIYWHSSYLNPARAPDEITDEMEFGTAVHTAVLEPEVWGKRVAVIGGFDDWRKKDAKERRDAARAAGIVPLLDKDAAEVATIAAALKADPVISKAFTGGCAERALFCYDDVTGIWCKARPDYQRLEPRPMIVQLKTAPSAHADAFERHAYAMGYFQRAAWEVETMMRALSLSDLPEYWFVVQEREPPYLANHFPVNPRAIEWGMLANARARDIFADCLHKGVWPKYRTRMIGIPSYGEFKLEERREAGEFETKKPGERARALAFQSQAPLEANP